MEQVQAVNSAELIKNFKTQIDQAAQEAVARAMTTAAELSNLIVDSVSQKVAQVQAPTLKVQVNERAVRELDLPASYLLEKVLKYLLLPNEYRRAVYLHGPTGCGKTVLVGQAAKVLNKPLYGMIFAPTMSEAAAMGRQHAHGFTESDVIRAVREGGILFLDEMDNAAPEVLVALNALRDTQKTFYNSTTGERIAIHPEFRLIAAGNTKAMGPDSVYVARQAQDGAFLSGFAVIEMDYDEKVELAIAQSMGADLALLKKLQDARKKLKEKKSICYVSTRQISAVFAAILFSGFSEAEAIKDNVTALWSEGLAESVGLYA